MLLNIESDSEDSNVGISESKRGSVLGLDIENQLELFGNATESRAPTNDFGHGIEERKDFRFASFGLKQGSDTPSASDRPSLKKSELSLQSSPKASKTPDIHRGSRNTLITTAEEVDPA